MTFGPAAGVAPMLREHHYLGPIGRGLAWRDDRGALVLANPTARRLPQDTWVELVRWCLLGRVKNAGSQQWAACVRALRQERPELTTVVSYSDQSQGHTGALYRACNWWWAPTWHRLRPPPTGNGDWGSGAQAVKDRWIFPLRPDPRRVEILTARDEAVLRRYPWARYTEPGGCRSKNSRSCKSDIAVISFGCGNEAATPQEGKTMEKTYQSCAETAKLLRQALKESFPGVKFSVRSSTYAGGASIRVGWTDGPTSKTVEAVSGKFSGAYFDGMIDYKGYKYHELDGQPVRFGADFIFTERKLSKARAEKIAAAMPVYANVPPAGVTGDDYFGYRVSYDDRSNPPYRVEEAEASLGDAVEAKPSATLARVKFTGDDGYGAGTVGTPDNPGGARGYPDYERRDVVARVAPEVAAAFDPDGVLQKAGLMVIS